MQEPDISFYKASGFDLVAVVAVIVLSVGMLMGSAFKSSQGNTALLYQNDRLVQQVSLGKEQIVDLCAGKMHIEVKGGKIRVLDSECPHHVCVNMGWIRHSGQTIACVPHRVMIEIKSASPAVVDTVAY